MFGIENNKKRGAEIRHGVGWVISGMSKSRVVRYLWNSGTTAS